MDYRKSVELALALGYEEVSDDRGFKGSWFIKEGLIWIHDIDKLSTSLGGVSEAELSRQGYDVGMYKEYAAYGNQDASNEMIELYNSMCVEPGKPVYLSDGMHLYPDGSIGE